MSSCRATSFYVAPGYIRYFRDTILATQYQGGWYEFSHHGGRGRFCNEHEDWTVSVVWVHAARGLAASEPGAVVRSGASVERVAAFCDHAGVGHGLGLTSQATF